MSAGVSTYVHACIWWPEINTEVVSQKHSISFFETRFLPGTVGFASFVRLVPSILLSSLPLQFWVNKTALTQSVCFCFVLFFTYVLGIRLNVLLPALYQLPTELSPQPMISFFLVAS